MRPLRRNGSHARVIMCRVLHTENKASGAIGILTQENNVRNGHKNVIRKVYVLFGNLLLNAVDHRSLEAAARAATVFVASQISVRSAEKSG